jgi:dTDP-glucose 4,6-dehydratase
MTGSGLQGREYLERVNGIADRVKIYYHDLSVPIDPQLENLLMERHIDDRGVITEKPIDYIINMASDSAVERSTTDPTHCLRNNYELTINMLEFARRIKPKKFLHISTDEVYGEAELDSSGHKEWDAILPSNPYAASKAAQEAMCIAYWRTYGVPVVLTNCMNIIGEWQDQEKFLPKIIQYVYAGKEMPIYGDSPESIGTRVYLHAKNKADALIFLLCNDPIAKYAAGAKRPDRYNICGEDELSNLELAQMVAEIMGKELKYKLVPSESARPGYDRRYALDGAKLREMGWTPPLTFRQSLETIVDWTLKHQEWLV